jgi:crossover junction endodeoxyribonuclease RusA
VPEPQPKNGPWRFQIPPPDVWVESNGGRSHWAVTAGAIDSWRRAGAAYAHRARLPHITVPVTVTAHVHRIDNRRADAANRYPTVKAVVDGLVDAGVLDDDSDKFVTGVMMRAGARVLPREHPRGLLTVVIAIDPTPDREAP